MTRPSNTRRGKAEAEDAALARERIGGDELGALCRAGLHLRTLGLHEALEVVEPVVEQRGLLVLAAALQVQSLLLLGVDQRIGGLDLGQQGSQRRPLGRFAVAGLLHRKQAPGLLELVAKKAFELLVVGLGLGQDGLVGLGEIEGSEHALEGQALAQPVLVEA
jgi:hypothetical protein